MAHGLWGVEVRSLETGEILYQLNPQRLLMPASNMKLVTLATAARELGWDHRFVTTLETCGTVAGGVLTGDLIVRGGGDPSIGSRDGRAAQVFADWAALLKERGIREIDGRIVGDDQFFEEPAVGDGWSWDDLPHGYAAPVGALQYNENVAPLTIAPGAKVGDPAIVMLPPGTGLAVRNLVGTSAAGIPERVEYRRHLDGPLLELIGTVPLENPGPPGSAPLRVAGRQVAVVNPTIFFVQSLRDTLHEAGVPVTGEAVDLDDVAADLARSCEGNARRRELARSESPALRDLAPVLMKTSQNLYAETMLKAAGAARHGLGSAEAGKLALLAALEAWNIDTGGIVLSDGSGLSRYNYLSPALLVQVLERMYRDETHRIAFMASLPLAGREGTVSNRMRGTRAEGNAAAKTGSISNVRALSGYVRTKDGEPLAFAILANNFAIPPATVTWIIDLAVEVMANFSRTPSGAGR